MRHLDLVVLCTLVWLGCSGGTEGDAGGDGGAGGEGGAPGVGGAGGDTSIPGKPSLKAEGGDEQVELSWPPVAGATSYDVSRATASGAEELLTNVKGDGYVDTDVTPETKYFYTLTAKNADGPGAASNEASATPLSLDRWHMRHNAQVLRSVAAGGGVTVAVGDGLRILTSTNGTTWTDRFAKGSGRLTSVAYGAGVFVAVGSLGNVYTSQNGETWTKRDAGVTVPLQGVAFGGNTAKKFVAVGDGSVVLTSPDGITWSQVTNNLHHTVASSFDYRFHGVAYGDASTFDYFVISASDNNGNGAWAFYMPGDGTGETWAPDPSANLGYLSGYPINGLGFGKFKSGVNTNPSMHLAGGQGFWGHAEESAPGTLTFATITAGDGNDSWQSVAFDGTDTLKFFSAKVASCSISTSCANGVNAFAYEAQPKVESLWGSTFADGNFIAVGVDEVIVTEPSGATGDLHETHRSNGTLELINVQALAAIDDHAVAVGGNGKYLYSTDGGTTFSLEDTPSVDYLANVRVIDDTFFVVGTGSTIMTSATGKPGSWTTADVTPDSTGIYDIATNGALYVAAGFGGATFTSDNGKDWTAVPGGSGHTISGLIFDGKNFIAATDDAHILTTKDGVTWKDVLFDPLPDMKLNNVVAQDGTIVVTGIFGHVWVSTDHGANWKPRHVTKGPHFQGLAYGFGEWIGVGNDDNASPVVMTSKDTVTWKKREATPAILFGVATTKSRAFLLGYEASVFSTH